jgi:hypothetical protein
MLHSSRSLTVMRLTLSLNGCTAVEVRTRWFTGMHEMGSGRIRELE